MTNLLRSVVRRVSPKGVGCSCGLVFVAIIAAIIALLVNRCMPSSEGGDGTEEIGAEANPRVLLGRVWFDKLPEKAKDPVDIWIFFGGGIGLHENGSMYRASFDIFEFERQGSKIDGSYLHDKKKLKTDFSVRRCDDHPPFDYCLTLTNLDGKKVELYGFGSEDEMEQAAPGSKSVLAAAKAYSETPRGNN